MEYIGKGIGTIGVAGAVALMGYVGSDLGSDLGLIFGTIFGMVSISKIWSN